MSSLERNRVQKCGGEDYSWKGVYASRSSSMGGSGEECCSSTILSKRCQRLRIACSVRPGMRCAMRYHLCPISRTEEMMIASSAWEGGRQRKGVSSCERSVRERALRLSLEASDRSRAPRR